MAVMIGYFSGKIVGIAFWAHGIIFLQYLKMATGKNQHAAMLAVQYPFSRYAEKLLTLVLQHSGSEPLEPVPAIHFAIFITCLWVFMCISCFNLIHLILISFARLS